jgi:hypothetical protein
MKGSVDRQDRAMKAKLLLLPLLLQPLVLECSGRAVLP